MYVEMDSNLIFLQRESPFNHANAFVVFAILLAAQRSRLGSEQWSSCLKILATRLAPLPVLNVWSAVDNSA